MITALNIQSPRSIIEAVLPSLPTGLPLEALAILDQVEFRDDIPTAAIIKENVRFVMALNVGFLARYAQTSQRQTMLVMHELMHLLLGHPQHRLSYRVAGLAFDAVINSGLVRLFPGAEFSGLLTDLYSTEFPEVLLRPVDYSVVALDEEVLSIHRRLYIENPRTAAGARESRFVDAFSEDFNVLYQEIIDLIQSRSPAPDTDQADNPPNPAETFAELLRQASRGLPAELSPAVEDFLPTNLTSESGDHAKTTSGAPLLGNHAHAHPSDSVSSGPGLGRGKIAKEVIIEPKMPDETTKRFFSRWLKSLVQHELERLNWPRPELAHMMAPGLTPNARDRYNMLEYRIHQRPVIWANPVRIPSQFPPDFCSLFLDVSASMDSALPGLIALLADFMSRYKYQIWQFSNVVESLHTDQLRRGVLASSRGTDLTCALAHILQQKRPLPVSLFISDADFKTPEQKLLRRASKRTRMHYLVVGNKSPTDIVRAFAATVSRLP